MMSSLVSKMAFDRFWHAALWANSSTNLVCTTEQLYDKATNAVQMNGSKGEWFRTTVEVRQGCHLSLIFFNIFCERITIDGLEEHDRRISIGNKKYYQSAVCNDTDARAEEKQKLKALVESLDKICT